MLCINSFKVNSSSKISSDVSIVACIRRRYSRLLAPHGSLISLSLQQAEPVFAFSYLCFTIGWKNNSVSKFFCSTRDLCFCSSDKLLYCNHRNKIRRDIYIYTTCVTHTHTHTTVCLTHAPINKINFMYWTVHSIWQVLCTYNKSELPIGYSIFR